MPASYFWRTATQAVPPPTRSFGSDQRGGVALLFGFAGPLLIGLAGGAIDYTRMVTRKSQLQNAVDAGVLAGGNTLKFAAPDDAGTKSLTEHTVREEAKGSDPAALAVEVSIGADRNSVFARAEETMELAFGAFVGMKTAKVTAQAKAQVLGRMRLCVLGLDPASDLTIRMQESGQVSASQCSVYSNSTGAQGIKLEGSSRLTASHICSAGGTRSESSYPPTPSPQSGCASLGDPLAGRAVPSAAGCTYTGLTVTSSRTLAPGTYCKGLKVTNGATVTLSQGVYVIDDGPLEVDGNATITGSYVGFYLKGPSGTLKFAKESTINLTAPRDGSMSGLLVYEDPSAPPLRDHLITSNNARQIIGTIYLPRGRLNVDAERAVADQSAYTVIVARQLNIAKASNLVMNANYAASDVPVPSGIGPRGGRLLLTQ